MMRLGKSLLLGSAAAIAATVSAQAADLPVRKAAPVDYVRVCDWTGVGYFYIPGTDTCIQVGGLVRFETMFVNQTRQFFPSAAPLQATGAALSVGNRAIAGPGTIIAGRNEDASGFFARGRIAVDTRTQTAYGTLRAYVRYQIDRLQGVYSGGGSGGANNFANQGGNSAYLDKGFITFAGISAGRLQSFFDFYADNYNYEGIANSDTSQNLLAYTYNGAGGFSATLSLEDHNQRTLNGYGGGVGIGNADNVVGPSIFAGAQYGGETIPDIVGNLRVDQAWGAAQLSAAYHEVNTISAGTFGINQGITHKDADGFAVQGGIELKLPMLAAGDDLWIQGAYEQGAYSYIDSVAYANAGFQSRNLGGFQHIDHDAIAIAIPGNTIGNYNLQLGSGFSVMAAINHYFSATFHDVLFGSYSESSYGRAKNIDWTQGGLGDAAKYRIGNQFLYDPVKNLEIGLEFDYSHIDQTLAHNPGQVASSLPVGISKNSDSFQARLRIERDF